MRLHRNLLSLVMTSAVCIGFSACQPDPPGEIGKWEGPYDWPILAVHMVHLHTGKVLVWQNHGDKKETTSARVWNFWDIENDAYTKNAFTVVSGSNLEEEESFPAFTIVNVKNRRSMFCAGQTALADGTILVAGGHIINDKGLEDTNLFDPNLFDPGDEDLKGWIGVVGDTEFPSPMKFSRWYPTVTTLPDGRVMVVSGSDLDEKDKPFYIETPEIYDPKKDNDPWTTLDNAKRKLPFYPFMFVLPNGAVFYAGAEDLRAGLDEALESYTLDDVDIDDWEGVARSKKSGGSAVMYEPGKILKSGGFDNHEGKAATNMTEVIDMTEDGLKKWQEVGLMNSARRRHQLTLLPDGTILATGGTRQGNREHKNDICVGGENDGFACTKDDDCLDGKCTENPASTQTWVAAAEIIDPQVNNPTWGGSLASMRWPRMYHSTALLLPDGRVLSAGGGQGGGAIDDYETAEIFSPPYLFDGENLATRPSITSTPGSIRYGDVFEIKTPDAANIDKVSLIRLGSVTHSFDQNQRFVPLTFEAKTNRLDVLTPESANHAPPGYYMLFIVNDKGVPSVAKYVRINQLTVVWVDFAYNGEEKGTFQKPFDTLAEGINKVLPQSVIRIKKGSTSETATVTKPMTIEAYGGSATIGKQ